MKYSFKDFKYFIKKNIKNSFFSNLRNPLEYSRAGSNPVGFCHEKQKETLFLKLHSNFKFVKFGCLMS